MSYGKTLPHLDLFTDRNILQDLRFSLQCCWRLAMECDAIMSRITHL